MGVVYAAYDPDLDRKVALKLIVRLPSGSDADSRHLQERLMREAKALARVAHPNGVAVHEGGRHPDQVFIAMSWSTASRWGARSARRHASSTCSRRQAAASWRRTRRGWCIATSSRATS
jgi:hypothetical protein